MAGKSGLCQRQILVCAGRVVVFLDDPVTAGYHDRIPCYRRQSMRSFLFIFPAVFALIGCGPTTTAVLYKQGMTLSSKQKDYDACKIKSFKEIPQNIVTEFHPGKRRSGTVSCFNYGLSTQCNTVGGIDIPASTSSHDANEGIRERFIDGCLKAKGYKLVELRDCEFGEEGYNTSEKAPPLSKIKCYDWLSPDIEK
jgi:hypothetical protein